MRVVSYYEWLDEATSAEDEPLSYLWAASWEEYGWKTEIACPHEAESHPLFPALLQHVETLPTVNDKKYELACYKRWCAWAFYAPALFVDYDVINFGFTPDQLNHHDGPCFFSVQGHLPMWADRPSVESMLAAMLHWSGASCHYGGRPHTSDMMILAALYRGVAESMPVTVNYGNSGWDNAKLVHFYGPRCKGRKVQLAIKHGLRNGCKWAKEALGILGASEAKTCRERLGRFCNGVGLDIGFGGWPVHLNAICVDSASVFEAGQWKPKWPNQHIIGDAGKLTWFADNSLDYVFSSHCLEDFEDTKAALREWLRVIKPGGYLVLFLPDQKTYMECCREAGQTPNPAHKHEDFGLAYVKAILAEADMPRTGIVHELWPVPGNLYSFDLVARKI